MDKIKVFLFTLIIIIFSINMTGQNHFLGIKNGISWSNTSPPFSDNSNYRKAFNGGITYDYFFDNNLSLSCDFIYNQRGWIDEFNYIIVETQPIEKTACIKYNYNYLSFPLQIGFNFGDKLSGFANIGIIPSVLLEANIISPSFDENGRISNHNSIDIKKHIEKLDWATILEAGIAYKIKNRYFLFTSFAYQRSFTNNSSNYFHNDGTKHYGIHINMGLKFALIKNRND